VKGSIASAWRVCRSYRTTGPLTFAYAAARTAIVPVGALCDVLTGVKGDVLSIGAGIGVVESFLADRLPELSFMCTDNKATRIAIARRNARHSRVHFAVADATVIDVDREYSAVMAIDVLHHIAREKQAATIARMVDAVRPDGSVIIKDIALTPAWKHTWNRVHDRVVSGEDPACREPEEVVAILEGTGCLIEQCRRLHPYSPYPHYLIVARKNAVSPSAGSPT
jgi:2-polyprenyl-3-methyl-5-hydroxy-6-metoxy-1,4-benzoquinol methylase